MVRIPSWWAGAVRPMASAYQVASGGAAARRITATPIEAYVNTARVPIGNYGVAQGLITAGGTGLVAVGPSGVGNTWYPTGVTVATTTSTKNGFDASTVTVYQGPPPVGATFIAGLSQVLLTINGGGGGGVIGGVLVDGQQIFAVWANANPGDQCTLIVLGDQDVLI